MNSFLCSNNYPLHKDAVIKISKAKQGKVKECMTKLSATKDLEEALKLLTTLSDLAVAPSEDLIKAAEIVRNIKWRHIQMH